MEPAVSLFAARVKLERSPYAVGEASLSWLVLAETCRLPRLRAKCEAFLAMNFNHLKMCSSQARSLYCAWLCSPFLMKVSYHFGVSHASVLAYVAPCYQLLARLSTTAVKMPHCPTPMKPFMTESLLYPALPRPQLCKHAGLLTNAHPDVHI